MTNNNSKTKNMAVKKLLAGILIGGSLLGFTSNHASADNLDKEKIFPIPLIEKYKPSIDLPEETFYPEGVFGKRIKYLSSINSEIFYCTAYCDSGLSANGTDISGSAWQYVAVDPYVIPLGSTLYIEFFGEYAGYSGYFQAVDTGGAIYGNTIDVHVGEGNYDTAYNFGRRTCRVTLIN